MKYLFSFILTLLILSCDSYDRDAESTYFGGKIINPKSKFVLFLKDDVVLDTIFIDKNNRFMAEFKAIEEGLYTFKHGPEFQYMYLEPKDSLLVRLNTWDFDESMVFSGIGSSKNEYLISLFLQNEKEEYAFYKHFGLEEDEFQSKLDNLLKERILNFEAFVENEGVISKGFEKLAHTAISYPLYRLKEVYPYYYKMAHELDKFPAVSDEFYAYRNEIDLDDGSLIAFYPFQNYLTSYLYHVSESEMEKDSSNSNLTVYLLNTIADKINHNDIKNMLMKKIIVSDFLKSGSTCSMNEKALTVFLENCTNEESVKQVKNLVHDSKAVPNDQPLNDFAVLSYDDEQSTIGSHIKDTDAVIYFWSTATHSSEYILKNIKKLESNFPDIVFIGINMETAYEDVKNEPNLKKLNINRQFKLTPDSSAHDFLTSEYPRVIIVNDMGVVTNGYTYLEVKKLVPDLRKLEKS